MGTAQLETVELIQNAQTPIEVFGEINQQLDDAVKHSEVRLRFEALLEELQVPEACDPDEARPLRIAQEELKLLRASADDEIDNRSYYFEPALEAEVVPSYTTMWNTVAVFFQELSAEIKRDAQSCNKKLLIMLVSVCLTVLISGSLLWISPIGQHSEVQRPVPISQNISGDGLSLRGEAPVETGSIHGPEAWVTVKSGDVVVVYGGGVIIGGRPYVSSATYGQVAILGPGVYHLSEYATRDGSNLRFARYDNHTVGEFSQPEFLRGIQYKVLDEGYRTVTVYIQPSPANTAVRIA